MRFCLERVVDDQLHRRLGADQPRRELRATPAGDQAEEHLGEGDMAHGRGDRAVVAVERDLDAAAERGAVDRGERRVRERAEAAEELVAGLPAEAGQLGA